MKSFTARFALTCKIAAILLFVSLFSVPLQAQAAPKVFTGEIVNLVVDEDTCLQGKNWCTELGTAGLPAANFNTEAVVVLVQLIKPNGQPITGLAFGDFVVEAKLNTGGNGVVKADDIVCPSCFFEEGDGAYRLVLQPVTSWRTGTYAVQLRVSVSGNTIYKLFPLEVIP